ncbi:MAG: DUF2911 domain-containing protein [Longimicrobiales bacterium]
MFAGTFSPIVLVLAGLTGDLPELDPVAPGQEIVCQPQRETANRASPYDSTTFRVGGQMAKVCYSRPYAKQRSIFAPDGLVPLGEIWRTGANEPTTLHLPVAATIAGIEVGPGSYSLYTIPDRSEWTIIVNRSTAQWGIESRYSEEIKAQEVGRAPVPSAATDQHVEQFTIRSTAAGNGSDLVLEWEGTRVSIPVRPAG